MFPPRGSYLAKEIYFSNKPCSPDSHMHLLLLLRNERQSQAAPRAPMLVNTAGKKDQEPSLNLTAAVDQGHVPGVCFPCLQG